MLADGGIEKTVTLIGNPAQKTDHQKQRHTELLADGEQTVAGNVDAGVFHVNRPLLSTQRGARRNGDRFLLARHGDQLHAWIVSDQRNDLAEPCLRQIGDEVDPRLFETLNDSFCQLVFHKQNGQLSSRAINRNSSYLLLAELAAAAPCSALAVRRDLAIRPQLSADPPTSVV